MSGLTMTSMERTMAAISHREPDKVPQFLLLSMYGAKELQLTIKEYFAKAENIVNAQLKMREKYRNDCIYTFFYAPIEIEAFGGEVIYQNDGPPNSGEPFIKRYEDIDSLEVPEISETLCLTKVLEATKLLKEHVGNEVPIIGVAMSPYSLPVMQMGFERYLEILYYRKDDFEKLMRVNEAFCIAWANAQLSAGATGICYFDPLASPAIIERELYLKTGYKVAIRTLAQIKGATATHTASGIALPVLQDIVSTGTAILGFSADDDPVALKKAAAGKICLLGNLNALEMVHWNTSQTVSTVKQLIEKVGKGGGFILSDNHGEIPWQVPERVLLDLADAVHTYGIYPLKESG
jgi:uroporphyrinogen decarboxylase